MDDRKPAPNRLCRLIGIRTDGTRLVLGEGFALGDAHWRRSAWTRRASLPTWRSKDTLCQVSTIVDLLHLDALALHG